MFENTATWQIVEWQPTVYGKKKDIPIECLVGSNALTSKTDPVHLYTGYGEEKLAISSAIKMLDDLERPAIGVRLPDSFSRDRATLEMTAIEAPRAVAQWFNERLGKATEDPVDVIGHSKGAGALLMAGVHAPEQYGVMGLIGPIGITNKYLGETERQRIKNYFLRIAVLNTLTPDHSPITDPTNILSFYEFAINIAKDIKNGVIKTKLDLAFSLDLANNVASLAKDHAIRLFLGEDDKLFTTDEYKDCLGKDVFENNTVIIPGSHSAMISRMGRRQLHIASDWRESVRTEAV